jgi:hypothetical protein
MQTCLFRFDELSVGCVAHMMKDNIAISFHEGNCTDDRKVRFAAVLTLIKQGLPLH